MSTFGSYLCSDLFPTFCRLCKIIELTSVIIIPQSHKLKKIANMKESMALSFVGLPLFQPLCLLVCDSFLSRETCKLITE